MRRNTKILIVIIFLSNLGWILAYGAQALDHGISLTYQDSSYKSIEKMLNQALVVANKNIVGKSLNEAKDVIRTDSYGSAPFIKNNCLYAGGLCLEIGPNSNIIKVHKE